MTRTRTTLAVLALLVLTPLAPTLAQSATPATRAELVAWATKAHPHMVALTTRLQASGAAATAQDFQALLLACQQLKVAVAASRADLPSPDVTLDDALIVVFNEFDASANHCIRGTTKTSSADIEASTVHLQTGGAALTRATAILTRLAGG